MVYTFRCVGGPLDGQVEESRFEKGFILVDKPADKVWIYDLDRDKFVCRGDAVQLDMDKAVDTALGGEYDVRSVK
jgi:hypothetical protein